MGTSGKTCNVNKGMGWWSPLGCKGCSSIMWQILAYKYEACLDIVAAHHGPSCIMVYCYALVFSHYVLLTRVLRALVSPPPMSSRHRILEPNGRWHATIFICKFDSQHPPCPSSEAQRAQTTYSSLVLPHNHPECSWPGPCTRQNILSTPPGGTAMSKRGKHKPLLSIIILADLYWSIGWWG